MLAILIHQYIPAQSYANAAVIKIESRPRPNLINKYIHQINLETNNKTMQIALNDNPDIPPIIPLEKLSTTKPIIDKYPDNNDKSNSPYSSRSVLYIQQKKANNLQNNIVFNGVDST